MKQSLRQNFAKIEWKLELVITEKNVSSLMVLMNSIQRLYQIKDLKQNVIFLFLYFFYLYFFSLQSILQYFILSLWLTMFIYPQI